MNENLVEDKKKLPFITVAMPVYNEEKFISDTLNELLEQDYPVDRYEIIVADGESVDSTRDIVNQLAEKHPQLKLKSNPGRLPSSGRNVGFQNGKGELFLVVDGHCRIDNNHLLLNLAEAFQKSGAQCLGRPQPFIETGNTSMQDAIAAARSLPIGHSTNSSIHDDEEGYISPVSVGCAYKKEVFERIGFVDEKFDACEDVEFNYRVEQAGFKSFFTPKIAIKYYPRNNLAGLSKQLMRYGEGRVKFVAKHPQALTLDMTLPVIFLLGLISGPFFSLLHPYLLYSYVFAVSLYLAIVIVGAYKASNGGSFSYFLKIMAALIVTHLSIGAGMVRGIYNKITKR